MPENTREAILDATGELLRELMQANGLGRDDVVAATFSVTPDLDQAYPAEAARSLGWSEAGLLCVQEMRVSGALEKCIRVCVLWETQGPQSAVAHRYLRGAKGLREDLLGA